MQQHAARLRVLLDEEAEGEVDLSPAGEAAVRAHMRLAGEALAATAGPATRDGLEDLAETLPQRFAAGEDEIESELALLGDAAARELDLQFGTEPTGTDPSIA